QDRASFCFGLLLIGCELLCDKDHAEQVACLKHLLNEKVALRRRRQLLISLVERRQDLAVLGLTLWVLTNPTCEGRFVGALPLDDSGASHGKHRAFKVFERIAYIKDGALQFDSERRVVLACVPERFDLIREDIHEKGKRYVLVIGDRIALAVAARRAWIAHDHHEIILTHSG